MFDSIPIHYSYIATGIGLLLFTIGRLMQLAANPKSSMTISVG